MLPLAGEIKLCEYVKYNTVACDNEVANFIYDIFITKFFIALFGF